MVGHQVSLSYNTNTAVRYRLQNWPRGLVSETGPGGWFQKLALGGGFRGLPRGLVSESGPGGAGFRNWPRGGWFPKLALGGGFRNWPRGLVSETGPWGWFQKVAPGG